MDAPKIQPPPQAQSSAKSDRGEKTPSTTEMFTEVQSATNAVSHLFSVRNEPRTVVVKFNNSNRETWPKVIAYGINTQSECLHLITPTLEVFVPLKNVTAVIIEREVRA